MNAFFRCVIISAPAIVGSYLYSVDQSKALLEIAKSEPVIYALFGSAAALGLLSL